MSNSPLILNKNYKKIDPEYFNNYGGGKYSDTYIGFTMSPLIIVAELNDQNITFETLLDVGCASGELVKDFRKYNIKAYGIDNNKKVINKSISPEYCTQMDMRNLKSIKDKTFDILYANSLMYLFPQEILPVLKEFKRICKKAVYLCNPFLNETPENSDPYRTFLATRKWWSKQFEEAGFLKLSDNIYSV